MKRVLVNEDQMKLINEAVEMRSNLPQFMHLSLDQGKNPFSNTGYFVGTSLEKMLVKRAGEIKANFTDDIDQYSKDKVFSKLARLIEKCKRKEEPIRDKLEKICNNTVVEIFGIPAGVIQIDCELVEGIPPGEQFHVSPDTDEDFEYDDVEAIEANDAETKKRRIVNALGYGASQRFLEQSSKLWLSEIFQLDEELPHLYSQVMKINEYLVFNSDVEIQDDNHMQGGTVETKLKHEGEVTEMHARGIIFPILLHEAIRGVVELIASYGLPDDIEGAKRVTNISDALENEPWDMRVGPVLWDSVCAGIGGVETEDFPYFFKALVTLPPEQFGSLMKNVFAGTRAGKEGVKRLYDESKYNNEYDKFTNDLALKQDRDVIEDAYFTDEEVEQWGRGYE